MVHKKAIATVVLSALFAFSASAFAGPTYSVEDSVARERLAEIKTQLDSIMKLLDVVKEKDLSMDVLDKAATERKNDSMRKLSFESASFMSGDFKYPDGFNQDWRALLGTSNIGALSGKGTGKFTETLMKIIVKQGLAYNEKVKNMEVVRVPHGDYVKQFDSIIKGEGYKSASTISACVEVRKQNLELISEKKNENVKNLDEARLIKDDLDKKSVGFMEDISKAKASNSDASEGLWSSIGGFGSILGNQGIFSGQSLVGGGSINYGAILSNADIKTLLSRKDTESITGAQERTVSMQSVIYDWKNRKGCFDDLEKQTTKYNLTLDEINQIDYTHFKNRCAEISGNQFDNLEVSPHGSRPRRLKDAL